MANRSSRNNETDHKNEKENKNAIKPGEKKVSEHSALTNSLEHNIKLFEEMPVS